MDFHSIVNLLQNSPNLRTFRYQFSSEDDYEPMDEDNFLPALAQYCPKLQALRYEAHPALQSDMTQLVQQCPDIRTIDLGSIYHEAIGNIIFTHCQNLQALRMGYIGDATVPLLLTRLPQMKHVATSSFRCSPAAIQALADHCGNLRSLGVQAPRWPLPEPAPDTMLVLLERLVHVEMLDLSEERWLNADLLLTIATHCKRLRCITFFAAFRKITVESITALIKGCPHLMTFIHESGDKTFTSPANRDRWYALRPGLTFKRAGLRGEYWESIVYDGVDSCKYA
jgi:hypothetical protein